MTGKLGQDRMSPARVGRPAPPFSARCTWARGKRHDTATLDDYAGSWLLLIFYPRDFTFVCPAYLSPEQLRGEPPTPATDVFGLGLVLFEMVSGRRAVKAGEVEETMRRARALRPGRLVRKLPTPYRGIVARMLRRDPAARPSMNELRGLLREVVAA